MTQYFRFVFTTHANYFMSPLESHRRSHIAVVITSRAEFLPSLYNLAKMHSDVKLTSEADAIGKSSLSLFYRLEDCKTGKLLYREVIIVVNVNVKTHMPENLSHDYVEKWGQCFKSSTVPRITCPSKPTSGDVNRCTRQVVSSDLDHLNHVNRQNYSKFCLDAAHLICKEKEILDINDMKVKLVEMFHKNEAYEGDIIEIYMWLSNDVQSTLCFQIERDNVVLTNAAITFYSGETNSKL